MFYRITGFITGALMALVCTVRWAVSVGVL